MGFGDQANELNVRKADSENFGQLIGGDEEYDQPMGMRHGFGMQGHNVQFSRP